MSIFGFTTKLYNNISVKTPDLFLVNASYSLYPGDHCLIKISFNNGSSWVVFLDTQHSINLLNQEVSISELDKGKDVIIKAELDIPTANQRTDINWMVFNQYIYGNLDLPGLEVDVFDSLTQRRINWGVTDQYGNFKITVPPGTYDLKVFGDAVMDYENYQIMGTKRINKDQLKNIPVGVTSNFSRFGLNTNKVLKSGLMDFIFSEFYKIQFGDYLVYDVFVDEIKRKTSEDYLSKLYCDNGTLYKFGSFIDFFSAVFNGKR